MAFIRGVNLGSYLVPEQWMVPSFYEGTNATSLCALSLQHPVLATERMQRHLDSFVGAADFAWLAEQGFNAVRVPLGWWNVVTSSDMWRDVGAGVAYAAGPYESLRAIDRLFE